MKKEDTKKIIKKVIMKQNLLGGKLMKEIRNDLPKGNTRSLNGLSDGITTKYLILLSKMDKKFEGIKGKVEESAFQFAKSIIIGKNLMDALVKEKDYTEKKEILKWNLLFLNIINLLFK
jgi:hypothetical protein